jgi:hypothetical protein
MALNPLYFELNILSLLTVTRDSMFHKTELCLLWSVVAAMLRTERQDQ